MKQYIYIILCAILLIGCAKESFDGNGTVGDGKTIEATFTLAPEFVEEITVRSVSGVDERVIRDVWVIQLSQDGTSQLQAPQYITTGLTAGASDCKVTVSLKCSLSKIYFITNTNSSTAYKDADTEDKVKAVTMSITADENLASATSIPMSGMWKGTPDLLGIAERVLLSRAMAKVNFNLNASLPKGETFILQSVTVKQIPDKLNYYRDASTLETYPYPVAPTVINYLATTYSDEIVTVVPKAMGWYLPENARGTVTTVTTQTDKAAKAPNLSTYIEIAGQYILSNGLGYATTYRIYLGANNTTDYNVKRNTHYNVNTTIRGIDAADTRINIKEISPLDYTSNGKGWFVIAPFDTKNPYNETDVMNWYMATGTFHAAANPSTLGPVYFDGWKLPTHNQLMLMWIYKDGITNCNFKGITPFWTLDEASTDAWCAILTTGSTYLGGKAGSLLKVRSIKETTTTDKIYPYVENGNTIVSRDTDGVNLNGVLSVEEKKYLNTSPLIVYDEQSHYNKISPKFKVHLNDCVGTAVESPARICWDDWMTKGTGTDGSGCPTGWRMPTQRELMLIHVMKSQFQGIDALRVDDRYWSSTTGVVTNGDGSHAAWLTNMANGASSPNYSTRTSYVRCVQDVE